jgi:predicted acylesterase/phospholipase RssA
MRTRIFGSQVLGTLMAGIVLPKLPVEVGVACQGGGMLGAYSGGALAHISECWNVNVKAVVGTSIGAFNVTAAALKGEEGLRDFWTRFPLFLKDEGASAIVDTLAHHMTDQVEAVLHCYRRACDSMLGLANFSDLLESFHDVANLMTLSNPPLLGYSLPYKFLQKTGIFDFEDIENSRIAISLNATDVTNIGDPFKASRVLHEIIFSNRRTNPLWLPIGPESYAASGSLPYVERYPIQIDNRLCRDGGFSSNPSLRPLGEYCSANGIQDIIVLRTRPTNSFLDRRGASLNTPDGIRAFFNGITDDDLLEFAKDFSKLRIWVIEPAFLEGGQKPEFNFAPDVINDRYKKGIASAAVAREAFHSPNYREPGIYIISSEPIRVISLLETQGMLSASTQRPRMPASYREHVFH